MISPKYFDHTILSQDATRAQVLKVCGEAKKYGFASVCVNSFYTTLAAEQLKGTDVAVCTVVGFPLGMCSTRAKSFEAKTAVEDGADEIDMVINVGALKDKEYEIVLNDIVKVRESCKGAVLKVIIETCLLTEAEIVKACELSMEAGADFVKTSTGFSKGGAKACDVALMKSAVKGRLKVKASGGIRDAAAAQAMIDAGADRLGTSATVQICEG